MSWTLNGRLKWAAAIFAIILAAAFAVVLFQGHSPFMMPGPQARVLTTLSHWAKAVGLKNTELKLFHLGRTIDNRRLKSALRSGRLVRVTLPYLGDRITPH